MEPMQLNGGRFYLRPLSADDRINDIPALVAVADWAAGNGTTSSTGTTASEKVVGARSASMCGTLVELRRNQWLTGTALSWAVCEHTQVEMVAEALLFAGDGVIMDPAEDTTPLTCADPVHGDHSHHHTPVATHAIVSIRPAGDPSRIIPTPPDTEQKTVGDAVEEAKGTITRWAEGYLGLTVTVL